MTRLPLRKLNPATFTLAVLVAAVALVAVLPAYPHTPTATPHRPAATSLAAEALAQLRGLTVLPTRPHRPGYQRGCRRGQQCSFGPAWSDDTTAVGGHNGCDTRVICTPASRT
jgi:hypothetical protein